MKEIRLTQDMVAMVDEQDYEWLTAMGRWQFDRYAYQTRKVNGRRRSVRMHRLIAEKMFSDLSNMDVDHINQNKLDNRRSNLRLLSRSDNCLNRAVGRPLRGAFWDKARNRWKAHIRGLDLGRYDTAQEAHEVVMKYLEDNHRGVVSGEQS